MKKYVKLISLMLVVTTMAMMLTGCSATKKAETTVHSAFAALKALDFEKASEYLDVDEIMNTDDENDTLSLDDNVFMETLFGRLDYEIISSEEIDENTVVVKTRISAVDMKPVLGEFFGKALQYAFASAFANPKPSDEEMNRKMEEMFVECASKEDLEMVTNEVDIRVIQVDKKWKIELGDTLSDALLGGLAKAAEEISNAFNSAN